MKRNAWTALLALVLCLSACQGTSAPPTETGSAPAVSAWAGSPAASAPEGETPAPEPEQYQLAPVPDETGLYQVVSSEEDGGPYELVPAQGEEAIYRVELDPEDTELFQVVPAPEGDGLYEVVSAQEDTYYRVRETASREAETVLYVADSARLPALTQEDLDQALAAALEKRSAMSVSVAVIEGGRVTRSGARGWAVKDQREMTPDTKVRIASLTKVALGMCAGAMAEEGVLDLDAPLSEYWGQEVTDPYSKTQPSMRTLLSHTAGLKSLDVTQGLDKLRGILSRSDSWRRMEPGDGSYWYYNNFGFCIVGTTLELASGKLLNDYLQERFFQPLDIRASLCAGALEAEELASLYSAGGVVQRTAERQAGMTVPSEIGQAASYCAGGLTISAVDLAKLVSVLAGDGFYAGERFRFQVLSPEMVAELEAPQFAVDPGDSSPFQQCLVLRRQENLLGRSTLYYHTGSAYGVYNLLSYDPDTGDGVVVLTVGGPGEKNDRGLYTLAADLSADLYARMEESS